MSNSSRNGQIVSESDVGADEYAHGQRTFRQYRLGHAAGGEDLGTSLYELGPGHRTWPAHYHAGNEEAIYVLDGEVRLFLVGEDGKTARDLEPGDYVALPTGPDHAHEVEASGNDTARFLVASTMNDPDFTVQPENRKVVLFAGDPPGEYEGRYLSKTLDLDAEVEFWDDRDGDDQGTSGDGTATDGGREDTPIVSETDLAWSECGPEGRTFHRKQLGAPAGGEQLGASLYELPPGRSAWRPHYHAGNEEALYVLGGEGVVRVGSDGEERDIGSGNYVALPRGEAGFHDIRASDETLRYLMVSTMEDPDITVYPEDGKVGLYAGSPPGGDRDDRTLSAYLDRDAEVDYWE